jgi:hypothetical protein
VLNRNHRRPVTSLASNHCQPAGQRTGTAPARAGLRRRSFSQMTQARVRGRA